MLQSSAAGHDLARRVQSPEGAPLGDVFAFISSLYFRGKLAYARAFARPPAGQAGAHVITPGDGLQAPERPLAAADIRRWAGIPVDAEEPRYSGPLLRDLEELAPGWADTEVVLLGSVASPKYVELLTPLLGERLLFPADFVGRGDMSRGGLMLRSVEEGRELRYLSLIGAELHGARPAKLPAKKQARAG
jgi:hypothetical protein